MTTLSTVSELTTALGKQVLGLISSASTEVKRQILNFEAEEGVEPRAIAEQVAEAEEDFDIDLLASLDQTGVFPPNILTRVIGRETDSNTSPFKIPSPSFMRNVFFNTNEPKKEKVVSALYRLLEVNANFSEFENLNPQESQFFELGKGRWGAGPACSKLFATLSNTDLTKITDEHYLDDIIKSTPRGKISETDVALMLSELVRTSRDEILGIHHNENSKPDEAWKKTAEYDAKMATFLSNIEYMASENKIVC